jgi:hypothetical protein
MGHSENKAQPNPTMLCHYVQQTLKTISKYFDINRDSSVGTVTRLRAGRPEFDFRQGRIFVFATTSSGPTGDRRDYFFPYHVVSKDA